MAPVKSDEEYIPSLQVNEGSDSIKTYMELCVFFCVQTYDVFTLQIRYRERLIIMSNQVEVRGTSS